MVLCVRPTPLTLIQRLLGVICAIGEPLSEAAIDRYLVASLDGSLCLCGCQPNEPSLDDVPVTLVSSFGRARRDVDTVACAISESMTHPADPAPLADEMRCSANNPGVPHLRDGGD